MVKDNCWRAARIGDFTVTFERVPCTTSLIYGSNGGGSNRCRGDVIVVRYADDFRDWLRNPQRRQPRVWKNSDARFAKFGLKLHEGKTRLIEFGRFAIDQSCTTMARGRPEPRFDFLGFTHQVWQDSKDRVGSLSIRHSQWLSAYACHTPSDQGRTYESEGTGRLAKRGDGCDVLCRDG